MRNDAPPNNDTRVRPYNDLFEGLPGSPYSGETDTAESRSSPNPQQETDPGAITLSLGPATAADAWLLAFRDKRAAFENMQRRMYTEFQALREENLRLISENRRLKKLASKYKRLAEER